jgi:hypothetical protein
MKRLSSHTTARVHRRLLLDSRAVDLPMAYKPIFVLLSFLKPLLFNNLKKELRFSDNWEHTTPESNKSAL